MRHFVAAIHRLAGGLLALLIVPFLAAAAEGPGDRAELVPVPYPDLGAAEPAVQQLVEEERAALDELLADPASPDSDLGQVFGNLGRIYHAYDILQAAAACYQNAHHLVPDEQKWIYLLAYLQQREGDLDAAAHGFETSLRLQPRDPPALVRLGNVELERQNLDAAEGYYRQALSAEPPAAHYGLGRIAEERKEYAAAVEHFEQVVALQPQANKVHYNLGQAYRRLGEREKAMEHLSERGPVGVSFYDPLIAELKETPIGAATYMQRGVRARMAGDLVRSVAEYRKAVEADPDNPEARRGLGLVLSMSGALEESFQQWEEALRLEPNNAGIHFDYGLILASHDASGALEQFEAAVRIAPGEPRFRRQLARHLAEAGRLREAAVHYDVIFQGDDRDADAALGLALMRAQTEEYEEARAAAEAVLELDAEPRQKAQAHLVAAIALSQSGDADQAIAHLRQAVSLDASLSQAHFSLANLLGMKGRYQEAAEHFARAHALDPGNAGARLGEGTALVLVGREADAARALEEAVALFPEDPQLAAALARLKVTASDPTVRDPAGALELALSAVRRSTSLDAAETAAIVLATLGRFEEAAAWQRRIVAELEGRADPELVARMRATLEQYERGEQP